MIREPEASRKKPSETSEQSGPQSSIPQSSTPQSSTPQSSTPRSSKRPSAVPPSDDASDEAPRPDPSFQDDGQGTGGPDVFPYD